MAQELNKSELSLTFADASDFLYSKLPAGGAI